MPGHELLVGIVVGAEYFGPCALLLDVQRLEQRLRHLLAIGFLGKRGVVACRLQHAYLVLYLHHDDHLSLRVFRGDVLHQCGECFQVGLQHIVAEA